MQRSIRAGAVAVNGVVRRKPAHAVRAGDVVELAPEAWHPPATAAKARPEAIPLEVVYEDPHLLVVDKPAGLVVHPAPGHASGTLVNAVLHHCGLPGLRFGAASGSAGAGEEPGAVAEPVLDLEDGEGAGDWAGGLLPAGSSSGGTLRPGIVHRLDKGTTGLLVVAKDEVRAWAGARDGLGVGEGGPRPRASLGPRTGANRDRGWVCNSRTFPCHRGGKSRADQAGPPPSARTTG